MPPFPIGRQLVHAGRCFVVAEVAQAHDGSLGTAHAYVDAAAAAGADAIKFQTHIADAESTPAEPWRVKFSRQDASRIDYWRRMEFSEAQWIGLREHAEEKGLAFLSSPFSLEAVDMLERVGVAAWKVASGEVGNEPMLDRMAASGLPVLLSTGMSSLAEIDAAVARIRAHDAPLALFQCTSAYPCPLDKVGLNVIPLFQQRYGCPVGLSDHSGSTLPALAAAALGSELLEIHVTFSREMFGPDVPASITTQELRALIEGIRQVEVMRAHPVDKDRMAKELEPLRRLFTKSVVARRDLAEGSLIRNEDLALKKPGTGIPASRLSEVVGRRLRRAVAANALLSEEDLA